jgi:hypothetical protein
VQWAQAIPGLPQSQVGLDQEAMRCAVLARLLGEL